jgi:hypothetical protein
MRPQGGRGLFDFSIDSLVQFLVSELTEASKRAVGAKALMIGIRGLQLTRRVLVLQTLVSVFCFVVAASGLGLFYQVFQGDFRGGFWFFLGVFLLFGGLLVVVLSERVWMRVLKIRSHVENVVGVDLNASRTSPSGEDTSEPVIQSAQSVDEAALEAMIDRVLERRLNAYSRRTQGEVRVDGEKQ